MKMLLSKGKLPKLKSIDFDMCESCILGKQKMVTDSTIFGTNVDSFSVLARNLSFKGTRRDSTIFGTHMDSFSVLVRNLSF